MGNIIRLDEHLANMIAAGEVIERPANVVKELVENAMDAGSTHIEVALKDGGLAAIAVTDNGSGMDAADAELAFERHATSKIKNERDLFRIRSLGFRGEALPSMAAVARVEMLTSMGNETGHRMVFQAGKKIESGLASARKGTSISVTKLFYNTPARLKYMKGPVAELAAITESLVKFAISHSEVAFTLTNDGKELLHTAGNGKILEVMGQIYGFGVAKMMKPFHWEDREYRLSGVLTNPLINRSAKSYVTLIANGRVIKNPKLVAAVIEAYDQRIPKGRYPIAVLEIRCDPLLMDVNIHPTKQEIKFSEDAKLFALIVQTLRGFLQEFQMVQGAPALKNSFPVDEQGRMHFETIASQGLDTTPEFTVGEEAVPPLFSADAAEPLPAIFKDGLPEFSYIGQYAGTYLLFQNEEGLYLLDQHAAAERIRYERYIRKMADPHPDFYDLMIPFNLDFSLHEGLEIQNRLPQLADFGVQLSPSGSQSFFLRSVPAWFPAGMEEIYAETVIRLALEGQNLQIAEVRDELAKLLACKHSIKANHYLNEGEISTLMKDLRACDNPYTCPHGRPVLVKIELNDIEKWFKRVM